MSFKRRAATVKCFHQEHPDYIFFFGSPRIYIWASLDPDGHTHRENLCIRAKVEPNREILRRKNRLKIGFSQFFSKWDQSRQSITLFGVIHWISSGSFLRRKSQRKNNENRDKLGIFKINV